MYCSKCYDERKYTRLELATWQDKIPVIVGIEEIFNFMTEEEGIGNEDFQIMKSTTKDWNENHRYCLCEKESHNKINNSHTSIAQSEPLDLSRSSSTPTNEIVELPTPRRSIVSNSNYSERELISAVRAICCGRIGTRRAAALYGIPRSTLRNRIFKVYDAKKTHEGDETMSMVDFFKKILKDDSMFSSVFQQKYQRETKDDKRRTIINDKDIHMRNIHIRTKDNHVSNKELFKNGLNEVMKHHQQSDPNSEPDLNNEEFSVDQFNFAANIPDIYNGFFPQSNHFQTLMSSYLYMMCQQNILSSVYGSMAAPDWQLPEFIIGNQSNPRNELGVKYESSESKTSNNKENNIKVEKTSLNDQSPRVHEHESLTIPDLSNGLVQSPSQEAVLIESTSDELKDDPETSVESMSKIKSEFNISVLSDETSESSRHKKRGHYRQYNTDMLNKAIEAVRSGEMSVHKAGNHFGVPHSTLEYRVKQITDCIQDEKVSNKRSNKRKRTTSMEADKQNDTESKKTDSDGCHTTSSSLKSQL